MMDFLSVLPSEHLARTAYHCQAYTRALRHIEEHVSSRPDTLPHYLTFLQVWRCRTLTLPPLLCPPYPCHT